MELPEKPIPALLREYRQLAAQDQLPIYVVVFNNSWVALEYLSEERDAAEYYYIDPSGYIGYGSAAAQQFQQRQAELRKSGPAHTVRHGKHAVRIKRKD